MIDWTLHIESNPKKLFGKPVIAGTRIPVDLILEKFANGDTIDDLLEDYISIKKDELTACILFAAESVKNEVFFIKAS